MQRNFQKGQGTGGRPGPEPLTEIHVFPPETALNSDPPGLPLWVGDGGLGGWVTMSMATGSGPQLPPQRLPTAQTTQNTPSLPGG